MIDASEVIEFLNQLVAIDRDAVERLIEHRVDCNQAMADHPTVQVRVGSDGQAQVGVLGLLNGLCGVREDGWGHIAAVYDEAGRLVQFEQVRR